MTAQTQPAELRHEQAGAGADTRRPSAQLLLSGGQRLCLVLCTGAIGVLTSFVALVPIALATAFWTLKMLSEAWFALRAVDYRYPPRELVSAEDEDLPTYTVLLPMYDEAAMVARLVSKIAELEYPPERLQVLFLLEQDDLDTWVALWSIKDLPPYVQAVAIPDEGPRGKPRALNAGLARATGELCVVYDAEDDPERDQLLRAVGVFRQAPSEVACVQARLAFYNFDSTWVSRFFSGEYTIHFGQLLPGIARCGLIPPLGGTSNHFRTDVLRRIASRNAHGLHAWDQFNVTEDADLAIALAYHGYEIALVDSTTLEEATASPRVALRQRSRWLKGYAQTGLAWARHPLSVARRVGPARYALYLLQMLGTPISYILNPLFWAMTAVWFLFHPHFIAALYVAPIYFTGLALLLLGNALKTYQLVLAVMSREEHSSAGWMLLAPLWWALTTCSAYLALWELLRASTRHTWRKTEHGHTLVHQASPPDHSPTKLGCSQTRAAKSDLTCATYASPADTRQRPAAQ
jgi:cellulose synthase/poly-beta-1,6-N-acetylglucosamine synthase-like glycosyltransferase